MIIVKNRELLIPNNERYIGTPLDNFADNRIFHIKRFSQSGEDLSNLTFRLDLKYPADRTVYTFNRSTSHTGGSVNVLSKTFVKTYPNAGTYTFGFNGTAWVYNSSAVSLEDIGVVINFTPNSGDSITIVSSISTVSENTVLLEKEVNYDAINLIWHISENETAVPGTVFVALRGSDTDATVKYASFYAALYVETNLTQASMPASGITELEQLENMTADCLRKIEYLYNRYKDLDAAALDAEAFARGTRNGYPVGVGDDAYHNNAKYYRQYAERYANGKEDGVPVSSGDGYHDNAKYWSEQANDYSDKSEAYAKGTVDGVPVGSGDPGYHDNSYYWSLISKGWAKGGTATHPNEENDNSEYWSQQSDINGQRWATGEVDGTPVPATDDAYHNNSKYWSEISHVYTNQVSYKKVYANVAEMVADTELIDGQVVRTLGYYAVNDGGGALYRIQTNRSTNKHCENLSNGLYALLLSDTFNLAQYPGRSLNEMYEAAKAYFVEYNQKTIYIPDANPNHPACADMGDGRYVWTVTAPIILGDESNCSTWYANVRIYAPNSLPYIMYVGGTGKPENIYFVGQLELLGDSENHSEIGLMVRNTARLCFDYLLINYCETGVQIGDQTSTNGIEVVFKLLSVGYFSDYGFYSYAPVPMTISALTMRLQAPLSNTATYAEFDGIFNGCSIESLGMYAGEIYNGGNALIFKNTISERSNNIFIGSIASTINSAIMNLERTHLSIGDLSLQGDGSNLISVLMSSVFACKDFNTSVSTQIICTNSYVIVSTLSPELITTSGTNIIINNLVVGTTALRGTIAESENGNNLSIRGSAKTFNLVDIAYTVTDKSNLPAADWPLRGKFAYFQNNASGQSDELLICTKYGGSLAWKTVQYV